jgi:hypothetical protein
MNTAVCWNRRNKGKCRFNRVFQTTGSHNIFGDEQMKTVVLYYSFSGKTKKAAEKIAKPLGAPFYQITETRKRSKLSVFFVGCPSAMRRKSTPINKPSVDLNKFDRIVLLSPIWAGFPAPAFNSMVDLLPSGKEVEIAVTSDGGASPKSEQGTKDMVEKKGCKVISYKDVKTGSKPKK